ncbi:MAG: Sacchrp dh protein, partial [Actinobacteria bacterium]|nr:Sacchrp dh protein [Actinomycetota bacterium]
ARKEGPSPPGSPAGCYFGTDESFLGLAPGRPAGLYRTLGKTLGSLGPVGGELSAAFLFWLRGSMKAAEETPAAVAGVWSEGGNGTASASIEDPKGILAGVLLAEVALKLASGAVAGKGLLPLADVIGRAEAERIATASGGKIIAG